jgi:Mn-containing catalase
MDIGTEELSHLDIVGTLARMHLKPLKSLREEAEVDPLIAIAGGGGVNLFNSMGNGSSMFRRGEETMARSMSADHGMKANLGNLWNRRPSRTLKASKM